MQYFQQFIEFPTLLDDEFDEFFSDRTGWALHKQLYRESGLLEPLTKLALGGRVSARMQKQIARSPCGISD